MKKTHSANIGGTVFHIEEDAYEYLQDYLHSIQAHFRSYPDVADIVADIEGRIAEQLSQRQNTPQVVRLADVERVMASMGRTDQFAEDATADSAATGHIRSSEARRLFRDPDNRIIAGVAAGLAAYLGVPRLLVRVLFVALSFFFGAAVVVYLLMWALAPVATSTTDKLQMRGRPLNLASIDQGVRDSIASIPRETRNMAAQGITALGSLIHLVVVSIARALKWAAGVSVVGIAGLGVLFLTVALVVALVNADAPPLHPGGAGFFAAFGAWQHMIKVLFYLVAAIPLAIVIATGLRLFWGASRLNARGLAVMLGVWVASLLVSAAVWSNYYTEVRQYTREFPAREEARQGVETYRALVEPTAPFSDAQSESLTATLIAEIRRQEADGIRLFPGEYRFYDYDAPRARVKLQEERIKARQDSNQRVLDSARSYLDDKQIALIQEYMAHNLSRAQADLDAWRERQL